MVLRCLLASLMLAGIRANAQGREHDHVQYRGTIDRRVPDARSASLVLSVWGSTDSTFRGYVTIMAPLGRSGPMAGRIAHDSLQFTSVSQTGDSIRWRSSRVGLQLGGDYEIISGAGIGQTGTWSVSLAHGTALAARGAKPAGSISSLRSDWPWWALLALAMSAFAWSFVRIWRHGATGVVEWDFPATEADARLRGVGGWMTWFLFMQLLGLLLSLFRLRGIWTSLHGLGWLQGEILPGLRPILGMEAIYQVCMMVAQVIGIVLAARLDRRARPWWMLFLGFLLVYCVADVIGGKYLIDAWPVIIGVEGATSATTAMLRVERVHYIQIVACLVWIAYWYRSRRVRLNFGPIADEWKRKAKLPSAAPIASV